MGSIHDKHRERMRNRIISSGLDNLEPHEVLEFFLYPVVPYRDTNPIAHELINTFGSLANVLDASVDELKKIKYIGHNAAVYLSSLKKLSKAYIREKSTEKETLTTRADVVRRIMAMSECSDVEEVYLICLNHKSKLLRIVKLCSGDEKSCNISLKEVAEVVLRHKATNYVLLAHTHPSGELKPSLDDIDCTNRIKIMLKAMGIHLADHLIIGGGKYFSLDENNLIK